MRLQLPRRVWREMQAHVAAVAPQEACGLLAGVGIQLAAAYPVRNELASPTHFRMDAAEQWAAFQAIEAASQQLLAIYHSHPAGPPSPSLQDVLQASNYPGLAHLIWSPEQGQWACRAFCLDQSLIKPVELAVQDQ